LFPYNAPIQLQQLKLKKAQLAVTKKTLTTLQALPQEGRWRIAIRFGV